ncbi:thiamine phosphate synthase [Synechococcus sp. MIT S9504]|uniref:thiamine phosphate synthase n=1 Tax=Synechococcus sp. MIT S9504 TaxID=1801628 RepID=UPI0007BB6964|nr:thiamine phosphate synthase [Synechococcus sp. MIT S9504]KZR86601.1 Thiamine-phosphate synthase [Synechococcus sp. MIT S9504]
MEWMPVAPSTDTRIARLIDANLDRAREGLRVIEDWCRFGLDRQDLVVPLKDWRQQLGQRHADCYRQARSTATDTAAGLSHPAQQTRTDSTQILKANASRVQEALRVIEEFARSSDAELAQTAANVRYALYDHEVRILEACGQNQRHQRLERSRLCLITNPDGDEASGEMLKRVELALRAGVSLVQYRCKQGADALKLQEARQLAELCQAHQALLIINDRIDLALLVDADGVHLGQEDVPHSEARQLMGPDKLIGRSTHRLDQLLVAQEQGADYLGVGPVYATATKADRKPAGLDWVRQAEHSATVPWFAIGGINGDNITEVLTAGASRVAVVSAIMGSSDPAAAARQLLTQLG